MSVSVEADGGDNDHPRDIEADVNGMTLDDDRNDLDNMDDQATGADDQYRKDDLESRLTGDSPRSSDSQESLTREEKLLEDMLRLKLVGSGSGGTSNSMLPPKQRIKLYQPRTKMEQFEDILLESQLLDQNLPDLGGDPLDYEKFDLESLSLQEALNGFTDYESTDAIFAEDDNQDTRESSEDVSGSCECDSCFERSALVTEMAEETKKLQQCWLQLREDFKCVYKLVLEEAWNDSNRPHPSLSEMQEAVHKLVWRDPHQLYQRLESQLKDIVADMKHKLVELLSKQAKNPSLAQDFIQTLLSCHEKLCEASKILGPVLSDLEVNHLRRFSLTWELLSKHMYQTLVYCDPLIQNNLPIFISQLRALYPNKENEDKYTELVRGYLDFDVDMENIGVFWSGAEALILDYSRDQQKLRDKQKMLKSDWEKFKSQRKQIENSLREKAETNGGGEEVMEDEFEIDDDDLQQEEGGVCECHACDEPGPESNQEPLFPPLTTTPVTSGSVYPHLYNLPSFSSASPASVTTTVTSSLVSSVASLSAALSSTLTLTSNSAPSVTSAAASVTTTTPKPAAPAVAKAVTAPPNPAPTTSPKRPTSLPVAGAQTATAETDKDKKAAPSKPQVPLDKRPTTCSHRHNNKNAKELKKMMEKDQKRKEGPKKSKSSTACHDHDHDNEGESTDEMSEDSDPEDSCSGSSTGNDKNCACCYCEVFGSGNPSGAPVPSNYPQMRERLRLLLSKKKRSNRAAQAANQPKAQAQPVQQKQQQPSVLQQKPVTQQLAQQQQQQQQQQAKTVTIKRQAAAPTPLQPQVQVKPAVAQAQDSLAKQDVDEIIDFIEGTGSASEKKRLKKERQKQQKFEVLRAKQEEERRRKAAEEAARKAIEEQERLRKEAEEKALKKSKKKAAQKAKKMAASGDIQTPLTPTTPLAPSAVSGGQPNKAEAMMDLENMQLEHIRQQKELLERQKRQLEEQQRKLDEELNRKIAEKNAAQAAAVAAEKAKDAANSQLSKKQAKKQAKKAAAASLAHSASSSSVNSASSVTAQSNSYSASPAYPQAPYPPYQPQPSGPPNYANPFQAQPQMASPYAMPGMYPGMGGPYQPPGAGYPQPAGGFSPFGAPPAAQPAKTPSSSAKEAKSDQPMVTIKRVMRPDTDEPTVTISVKKDDPKAPGKVEKQKEQVLFTLVNGQVLKTPSAPDNLIPSAVPMPKDLQQKILPEEEKLSKKQRKKLNKAQAEAAQGDSRPQQSAPAASKPAANLPTTAQGTVDLDRLRLPDGVSISKINGPVPERKYFPVKSGPEPGPQIVQSNPWSNNGPVYGGQPHMGGGQFSNMYGGQPMQGQGDNVIVVDPNSNEEKSKGKKKKNKNKDNSSNNIPSPMVQQPPVQPQVWSQQPQMAAGPAPGMFGGMRPSPMASQPQMTPQPPASSAPKSKEWTPAQYGGYVPPSDGKGGGQVLIKSVNGKVVITPIPGTGDNPPLSSAASNTTTVTTNTAAKKATPVPTKVPAPAPAPAPVKKQVPAQVPATNVKSVTNGTGSSPAVNGNPVISNGNNNNDAAKENNAGLVNGNNKEEAFKKMKKHKSPELDDYNSIFDPRNMDCGEMDAADREIEQFKLFCRDSVPVQNRTKVSFDVRNIAFKKKL